MKNIAFVITCSLLLIMGCGTGTKPVVVAGKELSTKNVMVVSAHAEASRAGAMIMAEGGNAVDAAVAVEFALAVCYPVAGNIGGGGFMVIRMADGTVDAIDYREKAPAGASREMYLDSLGNVVGGLSLNTHLGAGVPGTVDGMLRAHSLYGKLPLSRVMQPAIALASEGFPLTENQAWSLNSMKETFVQRNDHPVAFVRDTPWKAGDTLRQPELASTLRRVMEVGREGFYAGETARLIEEECKRGNGIITQSDLSAYQSVRRKPLETKYRGYRVITMPPPSAGGIVLAQLLTMTDQAGRTEDAFQSPSTVHFMAEAERRAYADRSYYIGDPDFVNVPVEELLNSDYLAGRMKDFYPTRATPSSAVSHGVIKGKESEETTHYSVVDSEGNAVAATTTINNGYGSAIVVRGAGFILNDEMDDFSSKPGSPNLYGLIGGEANAIEPGKRMLSSMTPTVIEKGGTLFMVLGSPGGSTITTSVYQVIRNVIDFGMSMNEAVSAPRFHHQWLPDEITYERGGLDSLTVNKLQEMGHTLSERGSIGRVDAILRKADGTLTSGADPRGDDAAAGW